MEWEKKEERHSDTNMIPMDTAMVFSTRKLFLMVILVILVFMLVLLTGLIRRYLKHSYMP